MMDLGVFEDGNIGNDTFSAIISIFSPLGEGVDNALFKGVYLNFDFLQNKIFY